MPTEGCFKESASCEPRFGFMTSARASHWSRWAGLLLVTIAGVFVLANIGERIAYASRAIGYPYELVYGEGQVFLHTERILEGKQVYLPIDDDNMVPSLYPPLYHVITAALTGSRDPLATGRLLSYAAMLLLAVGVGGGVWLATSELAARSIRGGAALFASLLFWSLEWPHAFAVLMRSDMLANLFAFVGFLSFLALQPLASGVIVTALCFVLAVFSRQSQVVAPAACGLLLVVTGQLRFGVRLLAVMAVIAAVLLVATQVVLGGAFLDHMTAVGTHHFDWGQALGLLVELCGEYPVLMALALLEVAGTLPRLRGMLGGGARPMPARVAFGVYFLASLGGALLAGKEGADVNYFIELMAVTVCCAMTTVVRALAVPEEGAATAADRVVAVGIPLLLLCQMLIVGRGTGAEFSIPSAVLTRQHDALVESVRRERGTVLSEDPIVVARAGAEPKFLFLEMSELALAGRWDQSRFVRRLRDGEFAMLVSRYDVNRGDERDGRIRFRLTAEMRDAIRAGYRVAGRMGSYIVYRPSPSGDGGIQ